MEWLIQWLLEHPKEAAAVVTFFAAGTAIRTGIAAAIPGIQAYVASTVTKRDDVWLATWLPRYNALLGALDIVRRFAPGLVLGPFLRTQPIATLRPRPMPSMRPLSMPPAIPLTLGARPAGAQTTTIPYAGKLPTVPAIAPPPLGDQPPTTKDENTP